MAKKVEDYLPKHKPKQTGRKGIGPKEDDHKPELLSEANKKTTKRQKELPGMEDKHLEDLESAAMDYAEVRDKRMALTPKEKSLKDLLLTLMKRHSKTIYRVEEMEIKVVAKDETVKVKMLSGDEED